MDQNIKILYLGEKFVIIFTNYESEVEMSIKLLTFKELVSTMECNCNKTPFPNNFNIDDNTHLVQGNNDLLIATQQNYG